MVLMWGLFKQLLLAELQGRALLEVVGSDETSHEHIVDG
jgi:hypothetical protein